MMTHAHRHGTAPVVRFASRNLSLRDDSTPRPRPEAPNSSDGRGPTGPEGPRRYRMNNLNSILLEGNLSREPELRYTPKGTPACTLIVASSRSFKIDGERVEEVSFIETLTVGKLATVCAEHLHQGRGIRAVGRIKQERWEDPDGNARSKVLIVAEHVEFPPLRTPQREREMAAAAS